MLSTNQNMLRFGQRKSKPRRVGTPLASRLVSFSMTAGSASHVFGKSLSGIESGFLPDRVVGVADPVRNLDRQPVELAAEADAVEAGEVLRGERLLVGIAERREIDRRQDLCALILRRPAGLEFMNTSGPEPDGECRQQLLPVFADRNDVVLDLDVGIGLLELGDDRPCRSRPAADDRAARLLSWWSGPRPVRPARTTAP